MTRPRPRTALRTAKRVAERAHQKAARYARAGATIASPAFLPDELVIDLFAGGGGASCGIEAALGRPVDIAINHDAIAMAVHAANHPRTRHLISNVWEVDPVEACAGRRVGLLWASPDCTHHSRAKGAKPLSSKRRALASVVVRWARDVRPRVIVGENVAEFADWGPLDANGRPNPKKKGASFKSWVSKIVGRGYKMEWRMLRACDFGTPTTRARLFFIARCDGLPIVWPEPTHGPGRAAPFRTAAECLDLEDFGRSIFGRKKSLADATLRRIAAGIERYVINAQPFIVPLTHQGDARVHSVEDPVVTVTCAHRGELALATPVLFPIGYGEREGQAPRVSDAQAPLATVVTNRKHALAVPVLVPHFGGANGNPCPPRPVTNPAGTVTTKDHTSLATAFMVKWFGTSKAGAPITAPLPTILTGGGKGGGHAGLVHALMIKYYGGKKGRAQTSRITDPVPTVVTKDRLGLVIVTIGGDDYQVVDIFLRMLKSSELKKAQGFAAEYDLSAARTKTKEIALVGNSVCQQVAEALIRGNAPGPVGQLGLFGVAA